ncbi:DUF2637 domain-containing protein [Sphaerisporangium rubeum]|uniref:TRAP-type C4-dicarboxylate transport system permease small subunit n=1 Tax=Sphaerisporangium rubeum TaxID=321317 RepID=A0A7X0M7A4_9ACTN|nr:DUF2637 domain-containing protein [Sphaerisporangium rubeum]MBB6474335.1 TRAP-type C4-dicarboxylate transport system permease small subunit [Sphaerisporangium rubeum]
MRRIKAALMDNGPVLVLAAIAAVGSFDHISKLAAKHGQIEWRAWAVAVCIDLMCVMAAREIQRDKRTGRRRHGPLSWPSVVLAGGITLTLAANLAEADPTPWGWIVAATPAGAFLIAMSMLERRAGHTATPAAAVLDAELVAEQHTPATATPAITDPHDQPRTELAAATSDLASTAADSVPPVSAALLDDARYLAAEHARLHDTPITADDLHRRLRIPPDTATQVLRHLTASTPVHERTAS